MRNRAVTQRGGGGGSCPRFSDWSNRSKGCFDWRKAKRKIQVFTERADYSYDKLGFAKGGEIGVSRGLEEGGNGLFCWFNVIGERLTTERTAVIKRVFDSSRTAVACTRS